MAKRILVTQRIDFISDYDEYRDSIDQRLIKLLVKEIGCEVYLVPNTLVDNNGNEYTNQLLTNWITNISPTGLVLSGGNDINQYPNRDNTEKFLLDWCKMHEKPVLGICRGMQIMGIWAGARLLEVSDHVGINHNLKLKDNENDYPSYVNSYHNYALKDCPPKFHVTALSHDGSIESIRHDNLNWEGWMWHPEREQPYQNYDIKNIRRLFTV